MTGKINNKGYLEIKRGADFKQQYCPKQGGGCGDWCPLFGEPEPELHRYNDLDGKPTGKTLLSLCHATLEFESLIDERRS